MPVAVSCGLSLGDDVEVSVGEHILVTSGNVTTAYKHGDKRTCNSKFVNDTCRLTFPGLRQKVVLVNGEEVYPMPTTLTLVFTQLVELYAFVYQLANIGDLNEDMILDEAQV